MREQLERLLRYFEREEDLKTTMRLLIPDHINIKDTHDLILGALKQIYAGRTDSRIPTYIFNNTENTTQLERHNLEMTLYPMPRDGDRDAVIKKYIDTMERVDAEIPHKSELKEINEWLQKQGAQLRV